MNVCKYGGSRPNSIEDRNLTKNLNQGKSLSNLREKVWGDYVRLCKKNMGGIMSGGGTSMSYILVFMVQDHQIASY